MRSLELYAKLVGCLYALAIVLTASPVLIIAAVAMAGVFLGSVACLALYRFALWIL